MSLTRDEAWAHLCEWTETDSLRKHARAVEVVMRAGGAPLRATARPRMKSAWGIAGMLHDADYEKWPEEHPQRIVAWLGERREPRSPTRCRRTTPSGACPTRRRSTSALLACDELTGFIGACCLCPTRGHRNAEAEEREEEAQGQALRRQGRARTEVTAGIELLEVDLGEHIQFIIDALKPHAAELGLEGSGAKA